MSKENLAAFRARLSAEPSLQSQITGGPRTFEAVAAVAASVGLAFDKEDLKAYIDDAGSDASELSDFELEYVSGGYGYDDAINSSAECITTTIGQYGSC